jgi:hypothetical protein
MARSRDASMGSGALFRSVALHLPALPFLLLVSANFCLATVSMPMFPAILAEILSIESFT